jgi:putative hydrolase of HD superfamily
MNNFLSHFMTIGKMKTVERWKWGRRRDEYSLPRRETTADHSYRMCMMAWYYADKLAQPFDVWKVTKMIYVHDLPEIITGDIPATSINSQYNSSDGKANKFFSEEKAMLELKETFDPGLQEEMVALRYEYVAQETREAKVASCIDKIESFIQILEYTDGKLFPEHKEFCLQHMDRFLWIDPRFDEDIHTIKEKLTNRVW